MNAYEIIYKKRNGAALAEDEICFFIKGVSDGSIPDYQAASWLMAVYFRGMNTAETASLTRAMTDSGAKIDLSSIPGIKADKHSTGGVGDGVSLPLAPLIAACGVPVPMVSGRGLGHTGGTLDKLESIPGYRVGLSEKEFKDQVARVGCAIAGQTGELCPADKKLYALRDVTATVDSIPLIAASIMSKKLAAGPDALVLDVKTGSGAFMKKMPDSLALAKAMVGIGKACGRRMAAVISDMDQPLGHAVGNAVEIQHAVEVLQGKGSPDFVELMTALGVRMLRLAGKAKDDASARRMLQEKISSRAALKKFADMVEAQGGDPRVADAPQKILPQAKSCTEITAARHGRVLAIDCEQIGFAALDLGAGRRSVETKIDYSVGFILNKKVGDSVQRGDSLARCFYNDKAKFEAARERLVEAYKIGGGRVRPRPLVHRRIA